MNITIHLNSGLTQVLADGTNTYTYGFNRITQVNETQTGYFLGDEPWGVGGRRELCAPEACVFRA